MNSGINCCGDQDFTIVGYYCLREAFLCACEDHSWITSVNEKIPRTQKESRSQREKSSEK